MASRSTDSTEDTQAITSATERALDEYKASLGTVSIADMLMTFNGSKSELAQALAGTSDKSTTAYKSQYKNVDRWLKGERNPARSKGTQTKFKDLSIKQNPPASMNVTVTGWMRGSDEKERYRTISAKLNPASFLRAIQAGDTRAAYQSVFSAYGAGGAGLRVASDEASVSIQLS
jgi:hypothetical protein